MPTPPPNPHPEPPASSPALQIASLKTTPTRAHSAPVHHFTRTAMNCEFGISLATPDRDYAAHAADAAFIEIARLEHELSRFIPTSEIAQLNAQPIDAPLRVTPAAFTCLALAEHIRQATAGAFDINYAARTRQSATSPTTPAPSSEPSSAPHPSAYVLDPRSLMVAPRAPLQLDLGGIGKGHALDVIAALLRDDWQISAGLVHAGQSTALTWCPQNTPTPWSISLRDIPTASASASLANPIPLTNRALAGSGQQLHGDHIRDPHTHAPAGRTTRAFVLAPTAALADALSTATMLMPADACAAFARSQPVCALAKHADPRAPLQTWGAWPRA